MDKTLLHVSKPITDELLEVIRTEEKICKYFDIPIQHVADDI